MARLTALALVLASSAAAPARASESGPLVVIIEQDGGVDPAAVRRELSARLDVPVVALLDPQAGAARAVLVVAVDQAGRRAVLSLHTYRGRQRFDSVTLVRVETAVVAEAAARFVGEMVSARYELPTEVIDPFGPSSRTASSTPFVLPPEVIDPWEVPWSRARARDERPGGLDVPRPRK